MSVLNIIVTVVLYVIISLSGVACTTDLNIHEIQYVADHLTTKECRQLVESLHNKTYAIGGPGEGSGEPDLTCIELLVLWDQTEGRNQTFHHLTHRLRQLGHVAVADKISKTVYHQKAEALKHMFLDDPFKALIHKDSPLLDTAPKPKRPHTKPTKEREDQFGPTKLAFTITGGVCLFIALLMAARRCCPGALALICPLVCPSSVVDYCETACSSITICCERFRLNIKKHLLGSAKGPPVT